MGVSLSKSDYDHLVDLLIGLKQFRTESGRVSLVTSALQGLPVENQIWRNLDLGGDVGPAAEELIRELCRTGRVNPEQEALGWLLRNLLNTYFGEADEQAVFLAGLIERYGLEQPRPANALDPSDLELQSFEPQTILIPAGTFVMGSPPDSARPVWEKPLHEVDLPAYRMGKFPVTCAQYAEFVHQTKRLAASELGWDGQRPPENRLNYPVTGITWFEALAYCQWLSTLTGRRYMLPNEAQWEKAARGPDGCVYPWRDAWDPARCSAGGPLHAVDAFPPQSVYGISDLVGNARQWTCSLWGEYRLEPARQYTYPWKNDGRNDLSANSLIRRVYRGGRSDLPGELICAARGSLTPDKPGPANHRPGFRVILF